MFESESGVTGLRPGVVGEPAAVEVERGLVDGLDNTGIGVGLTDDVGKRPSGVEADKRRETDDG